MKNKPVVLLMLLCVSVAVLLITPFLGTTEIPLSVLLGDQTHRTEWTIFWDMRIPRVYSAFISGAALAISGMTFQAIFRTSLATPFTLGVASGASLGAVLYIQTGLSLMLFGVSGISIASFLGAILTILVVYGLARYRQGMSIQTMLLAGVAISFFCSSLILCLQYLNDFTQSFRAVHWLMGGLDGADYQALYNILPFVAVGGMVIFYFAQELNLMRVGEEIAISRGVSLKKTHKLFFLTTSLMVGSVVANWGPIGFVGIMVPHLCRLLVGSDHRFLTPATFLFGGVFLTLCDTLARTLFAPVEIPVGIITSLLGGPFFIWLLVGGRQSA